MSIHEKIQKYKKASRHELRNFGLLMFGAILFLFYVMAPFVFHAQVHSWPFFLACYFFFFGFFLSENLLWIYIPWMLLAEVLGGINTRIILGLFFFVVMTPLSLCLRLLGKDALKRKLCTDKKTYREKLPDISLSENGF